MAETLYSTASSAVGSTSVDRANDLEQRCNDVYANVVKTQMTNLMGGAQGTINKYSEVMSLVVISTVFQLLKSPGVGNNPAAISPTFNEVTLGQQTIGHVDASKAASVGYVNQYVQSSVQTAQEGLQVKDSVRFAVNVDLSDPISLADLEAAMSMTLEKDDRILLFNQSGSSAIFKVSESDDGTRVLEDTQVGTGISYSDYYKSAFAFVQEGQYFNQGFVQTNEEALNGTELHWTQFTGAGSMTHNEEHFNVSANSVSLNDTLELSSFTATDGFYGDVTGNLNGTASHAAMATTAGSVATISIQNHSDIKDKMFGNQNPTIIFGDGLLNTDNGDGTNTITTTGGGSDTTVLDQDFSRATIQQATTAPQNLTAALNDIYAKLNNLRSYLVPISNGMEVVTTTNTGDVTTVTLPTFQTG